MWLQIGQTYYKPRVQKYIALKRCKNAVAAFGFSWDDMTGRSRCRDIVDVRHMVMRELRDSGMTYKRIGNPFSASAASFLTVNV